MAWRVRHDAPPHQLLLEHLHYHAGRGSDWAAEDAAETFDSCTARLAMGREAIITHPCIFYIQNH